MKVIKQNGKLRHFTGLSTKKYKLRSNKVQKRLMAFALVYGDDIFIHKQDGKWVFEVDL